MAKRIIYCEKHASQPLELYCKDHDDMLCTVCSNNEHFEHNLVSIQEAVVTSLENEKSLVGLAMQRIELYNQQIGRSDEVLHIHKSSHEKMIREIEKERKAMQEAVNKHYKQLTDQSFEAHFDAMKEFRTYKTHMEEEKSLTQRILKPLSVPKNYRHPVEIINLQGAVQEKLNQCDILPEVKFPLLNRTDFEPGVLDTAKLGTIIKHTDTKGTSHPEQSLATPKAVGCPRSLVYPCIRIRKSLMQDKQTGHKALLGITSGTNGDLVLLELFGSNKSEIVCLDPRTLERKNSNQGSFYGLCTTKGGTYALTDQVNKCVAIYDQNLVYQGKFGTLQEPRGICTMKTTDILICTDIMSKCVSYFDVNTFHFKTRPRFKKVPVYPWYITTNSKGTGLRVIIVLNSLVLMTISHCQHFR
ncbi:unnamed protein product [Owenia fusiformis]|uniref:B box-type domain-containing protein n=1 Tax=Owenia fusiformis TaxID=6347 RepID=A0A8S4PS63_OWEFU|nr:unnamed protein product [Owenia fusiformis]